MKKSLIVALFLLVTASVSAQESGMSFFHGTWDEVTKKAKDENKLVFIDFYTKWCGPCKMMAEEVFVTKAIGDFYNGNFINYKVDAETPEGSVLARKYKVSLYPTFVFVDPSTLNEVHISTSRQEENIFMFTGQSALSKDKNSVYLEKMALEGSADPTFMYNYAFYKSSKGESEVADKYISMLTKIKGYDLSNPIIWKYFTTFVKNKTNPLAIDFLSQREKYSKIYGETIVNNLVYSLYRSIRSENELASVADFPGKEYLIKKCRLENALGTQDYILAKKLAEDIMSNPCGKSADLCNDINYIVRLPRAKDSDKTIQAQLLEIYLALYRFAAYNIPDRDNGVAHFNYASLLEYLIKNKCAEISLINEDPKAGTNEYSMRPLDLAKKPTRPTK